MMNVILDLLQSKIVLICIFTWFVSQLIKFTLHAVTKKKYDYGYFYRMAGGEMPSSHAAVIAAFTTIVYLEQGNSLLFLLAGLTAVIVMYDAIAFRRQLGKHAVVLNSLVKKAGLQYRVGHEPAEVIVGAVLGIVLAVLLY